MHFYHVTTGQMLLTHVYRMMKERKQVFVCALLSYDEKTLIIQQKMGHVLFTQFYHMMKNRPYSVDTGLSDDKKTDHILLTNFCHMIKKIVR